MGISCPPLRTLQSPSAASIAGAALLALGYLVTWGFWPLLLMSSAAAVALAPVAPVADALALGAAERRGSDGRKPFDYGWVRGAGSAAFIAGSLLSGQAIAQFDLTVIVLLQAGLFAIAAIFTLRVPQESLPPPEKDITTSARGGPRGIGRLLAIPLYRRIGLWASLIGGDLVDRPSSTINLLAVGDLASTTPVSLPWRGCAS